MRRICPFGIFACFFTIVRMDLSVVLFSNLDRRMTKRIAHLVSLTNALSATDPAISIGRVINFGVVSYPFTPCIR